MEEEEEMMSQFLKNLMFVTAVGAAFIGIPFGVSELVAKNFVSGSIFTPISGLAFVLSIWVANYYHNRDIDLTIVGYLAGLLVLVGGSYAMIAYGFTDTVVFAKLFIIAIAILLHALVETENAFWAQKAALAVALVSVAFFSTPLLLGIGAGISFILFIISMILHAKHASQKERIGETQNSDSGEGGEKQ